MFRKLQSLVSPMSAMRIQQTCSNQDLEARLHLATQYLVSASKQFDAWMELQNHNKMHLQLMEIYTNDLNAQINQQKLANIIQFYTLLIINCKDELLICKLVSDDFVIQMCSGHDNNIAADLQAYRINLIKAYMSTITPQIVKYMVVQDTFKVFDVCVRLYVQKMGSGTVQVTTIANSLLNVMKKVESIQYLWESVWTIKGLQYLFMEGFNFIGRKLGNQSQSQNENENEKQVIEVSNQKQSDAKQDKKTQQENTNENFQSQQLKQQQKTSTELIETVTVTEKLPKKYSFSIENMESIEQTILFIVELVTSVNDQKLKQIICSYCYMYLSELLQKLSAIQQISHKIHIFSILFPLFQTYGFETQAIDSVLSEENGWFEQLLKFIQEEQKGKMTVVMARGVFVLGKIVNSKHSLLSQRALQFDSDKQTENIKITKILAKRQKIMKILIERLRICLDQIQNSPPSTLMQFIKSVLLTVLHLKIAMSQTNQLNEQNTFSQMMSQLDEAILQIFLSYISEFRKLMYRNQKWGSIIKWYQQGTSEVANNLLSHSQTFQKIVEEPTYITMLTYEYIKNYRYMIVEETTLSPKAIKQQKFYHSTFSSPGLSFAPGSVVKDVLNIVCCCTFHHNYQQIPVVVIEDKQCFLVAVSLQEGEYKIVVNVKFKDIEGLIYGSSQTAERKDSSQVPKFVKINLRGSQQVILQFPNPKIVGNAFKDYLIRSRDMTRQRQLTFLNAWVKDYQTDTEKTLAVVKQKLKKQDYLVI